MRNAKIEIIRKPTLVRPFYTITELADLFGKSRLGTRNMLLRMGIRMVFQGNRYILFLSDIKTDSPALFASIMEANAINTLLEEDLGDRETSTKNQFQ